MAAIKTVVVNNKGMITIPAKIREKHNLYPGTEVSVLEIDGNIVIVPVLELENIPKASRAVMAKTFSEIKDEELELEK